MDYITYIITYIIIYIIFGLLPSIIWLLFYLRKDSHPESNGMVLKMFIYGILIALVAAGIEIVFLWSVSKLADDLIEIYPILFMFLNHFIGIALIEEYLKYLTVKQKVLDDPEFDEPVDAMLYMIIVALGFAALENILVLFPTGKLLIETISISIFRFLSATFLHALASGIVGYFLALSLLETKKRFRLITFGILTATVLHGIYNVSIMKVADSLYFIIMPIVLLIGMALFVSHAFRKLKNLASVCK